MDVLRKELTVETETLDEISSGEKPFPCSFGRFLTFAQPGNLESYKWKAHPHPQVTGNLAGFLTNEPKDLTAVRLPANSPDLPLSMVTLDIPSEMDLVQDLQPCPRPAPTLPQACPRHACIHT